jgi:RNA polymerase sigma factor (TIGR02999 family)
MIPLGGDRVPEAGPHEITALLERVHAGDKEAENQLFKLVMPQLRKLARHVLSDERRNHTLQGTELVNEAYLRLAGADLSLQDRGHFFAILARAMRRELIDYGRRRRDVLRLDGLPENIVAHSDKRELALTIDELLDQMQETMPVECTIVELKFFFGMTDEETAEVLGLPLRTMQAKWQDARIWLFERAEAQQWRTTKRTRRSLKI